MSESQTTQSDGRELDNIAKKSFRRLRNLHQKWKEHNVNVSNSTTLRHLYKLEFQSSKLKIRPFMAIKQKRVWSGTRKGFY